MFINHLQSNSFAQSIRVWHCRIVIFHKPTMVTKLKRLQTNPKDKWQKNWLNILIFMWQSRFSLDHWFFIYLIGSVGYATHGAIEKSIVSFKGVFEEIHTYFLFIKEFPQNTKEYMPSGDFCSNCSQEVACSQIRLTKTQSIE